IHGAVSYGSAGTRYEISWRSLYHSAACGSPARGECCTGVPVNFRWRLALWFGFLSFTSLALAQTVPASTPSAPPDAATPAYCRQVSQGVEHGDVLEQFCNWAVSLRERLPNLLCEQTTVRWRQGYGNDYRKLDT